MRASQTTLTFVLVYRDLNLMNPRGCRQVGPGAVTMMAYPMQRMTAFKQQGDRPQFFGLCLRVSLCQYLFEHDLSVVISRTCFKSRCRDLVRCMVMHVLCCAVLCCAVLCCAVLCYYSDTAWTTCLSLLRIAESGWAPPLPLESSDSSSQAGHEHQARAVACTDP